MNDHQKPDRSNRIVLVIMGVLALVTIGGTIIATMGEWRNSPPGAAPAEQGDTGLTEDTLPSAGY